MAYVTVTRVYSEETLAASSTIALDQGQTHYLRNVLRLGLGDRLTLFNGRDGEWWAEIVALGKHNGAARLIDRRRPPRSEPDLWLLFAPVKRARIDFLVEKATELGVSALYPVMTERTIVERVNLDRLGAHIREAAEQTERLTLPVLHPPAPLMALLRDWPADRRLLLADETGTGPAIADRLAAEPPGKWAVLIGPEGGFSDSELDALRKLPFVCAVSLGPRVLRADTAAIAALSVLQAFLGDWRAGRGA